MPDDGYTIPSRFSPSRSLLGRWIRRYSVDARQAESTYVVAAVLSVVGFVLIHLVVWSTFMPKPTTPVVALEAALLLVYLAFAFAGRDPSIAIIADASALKIRRGGEGATTISYEDIDAAGRIDAHTFHRHYRRYAETRIFVNRIHDELLLLRWNGVPVVLGLRPDALDAVERTVENRAAVGHASSHVDAA